MESCLRGSKRNTNNTNTNKSNNTQNRTIKQQQLTREDYYLEQQQQQQQQNTKQQYEEQELEDFQLYQLQRRKQKAFLQRQQQQQQQQQQQNVNSNENCAQVFATTTLTTKPKFVNNCLQFSAPPPPNYPPPILNATTTNITTTSIDTPTTIDTTTKMANRQQQQQQSGLHSQHHLHMQQQQQAPNNLNLQLQHHVQSTINTLQQQINNLHIEMDTNNRDTRIMNMSHQHQHSHQQHQQQHPHSHQHQHGIHQQLQHGNGNGNGLMGHGHGHGHHGISALNSSRSPTSTLTSSSSSTSVSMNSGNNMGISPCSRRGHGAMPRYPDPDPDAIEICNKYEMKNEINLTRRRDRDRDRERGRDRDREHRERERERQLALEAESMHWPATPHTSSHDYSYAYYEPGVAMRHSNIPAASISPSLSPLGQTPQPPPPPNSMRALLSKGKKNKSLVSAATRHCYQTRYGMRNGECAMQLHPLNTLPHNMLLMHENFYEEISTATEAHAPLRSGVNGTNSHSAGSLNQSLVEEELRRVQSRHRKILGELNLSVEAMLMPESPPPTVGLGCEDDVGANKEKPTVSVTASSGQPNMVSGVRLSASSADNICASSQLSEEMQNNSQLGFCAADLDSGFSGSSGASYIGSLRIHKTNAALSQIKQEKRQVQTTSSGTGTGVSNSLCPFPYATQSCRSFQRGNVTTTRLSQEDDADNDAGFLTRASCGRRILNCAKLRAAEDPGPVGSAASAAMAGNTPPTMSKARSFWNRKGWRKLPGFSTSTSSINDTGLTDETKLNSSSWDDPSSTSLSNNNNNISLGNGLSNGSNTTTTAQLHNSATLRCNDSLKLPIRQTYKGLLLPAAADCEASTTSNGSKIAGGSINSNGGGGSGGGGVDTSTTVRPPLEHSISWCSSQAPEAEEEEELSDAGGPTSATHHLINRSNTSLGGVTNTSDEEATVTEDESNLTTSLSANNQRNSQLRSTFNRAKQHLDKWRSSTSSSSSNSNSISSTTQTTQNSQTNGIETLTSLQQQTPIQQQSQQAQQQQQLNQQSRRASTSATMPTAHQSAREEITTPGETPTGRLSRWFSIRRGSSHQYDIGGRDGRHSAATSLDIPDASTHNCGDSTSFGNNQKLLNNSAGSGNSYKMPGLPENDDDENINLNGNTACAASRFDLDLMIPPGSRANGTARNAHTRLITPMLPPAPPGLSQQQLKRRHIVAAIVHSENSYVATLQRLVNDYKKPLEESNPPVLSANKIGTLFHRLPEILQSHKLFRISLSECVLNWDRDEKLGDCFVSAFSKPSVLEIYSGFINNFSAAMELAKMEEKRKSALADFFKVKQISAHDRLSFFGLMVKPVQRFPQFILFLQDLLKYTPQGHHDRMSLQLALTQLELLAELLNERKREAEQHQGFKEMLGHISGTFNARSLLTSADGARPRYLLREDNVTHLEFNQAGFVIKSKQRRLLLLNDKVICVSVAPKQSHDFGATEKLTFKWMYPVTDVEIVDNSTSATLSRILTAGLNRGGSLKSTGSTCNSGTHNSNTLPLNSTYPNNLAGTVTDQLNSGSQKSNGADNLCNEMSTLMYDYEVISRIHDLVGSLKSTYKELNTNITRNLLNSIQGSIQRKDEEMAWVDSCCLQLIARNKSGKEETFTFQTQSPNVKKEWMTELRLAQLALDTNNSPAWETAAVPEPTRHNFEQIQTQHKQTNKLPLFVKAIPVYKSQHQTEVRCGCYYTIANDQRLSGNSRRRAKQQNYLWICTSDGHTSHMAIYTQNQQQAGGNLRDVGSFDLEETQVCAMEFVKGLDNCKTREEYNSLLGDLIWFGTDAKKILIYSAQNPEQEQQLAQCTVPGTVTRILYHFDAVYVALSNAMILIYRRSYEGLWLLKEPQQVQLGESGLSVPSILPINMNIYACCANRVYVLNALNGEIQKSFEVHHGANQQVNLMAHSGIGLWISLKNSTMLCLYHTETFKHLQDINIASSVLRHDSKKEQSVNNSSIYVTALMACKGLLWVGTNVGIAVTIPLPRLEGVPIISGGINMSCHAHFGPITFLLPLIPKVYPSYKPPSNLLTQLSVEAAATPTPAPAPPSMGDDLQLPAIDADPQKLTEEDLDESTVILRRDIVHLDSNTSSPRSSKLEKQSSLDQSFSAKIRASLAQSPAFHRKRFRDLSLESSRTSKTLPRALGSTHSNTSTLTHNEHGYCDVYGLYGKLIFVKENYDADESAQGNLMDMLYADMRRSDPELAAIPGKVSTLDRRLRMKASRPRSLDLSNWSVDSKSSSLYTSSGSEESMGIRLFGGRSVSRNSSSASHKTSGNGSDLGNISENGLMTTTTLESYVQSTPKSAAENAAKKCVTPPPAAAQATLKRKQKQNAKQQQQQNADGPRTIITLMGGRGYWRHVWYNNQSPGVKTGTLNPSTSGGNSPLIANSNDAHIVMWEKKL